MQITEERRRSVIDLYFNQHKSYAEIVQIERISPRDIHTIIKEEQARRQKLKQQELSSKAYQLFSEGKTPIEVATLLNLPASKVSKLYREYWTLRGLDKLNTVYKESNGKIWIVLKLYKELIKKRHMSIEQVVNVVEIAIHKLPYMESLYQQAKDQAEKMQRTIQRLTTDIRTLESKISILDKTAFSIELDCKRTEQQLQELIAKKDRIEKLIATMLSDDNEDYTKLKAIVKESVKAALSDNKMLISISFAALLQTLEDNPEMANLIYSIPLTNNREQYEDNNNNITKYFEVNKASIIDLAEKHYENLVEALTNNVINTAAGAASNPPPSLPSSSAFLGPYNKSDTYKTDKEEMFHHSKGDIAD